MGGYSFSSSFKWIRDSGRKFGLGKADYNLAYQDYHKRIIEHIKAPTAEVEAQLKEFLKLCTYVSGQYDSDPSFVNLESVLQKIESGYEGKARNRVFYMALPPSVFVPVAQHLKRNNYIKDGISRIIVEKPFGSDLESSREMQTALGKEFSEEEVSSIQSRRIFKLTRHQFS